LQLSWILLIFIPFVVVRLSAHHKSCPLYILQTILDVLFC
jgi:hypothetical protein